MKNKFENITTATQEITRALLKIISGIVIVGGFVWGCLEAFNISEAPEGIEDVVLKADSVLFQNDSLKVDTNAIDKKL